MNMLWCNINYCSTSYLTFGEALILFDGKTILLTMLLCKSQCETDVSSALLLPAAIVPNICWMYFFHSYLGFSLPYHPFFALLSD